MRFHPALFNQNFGGGGSFTYDQYDITVATLDNIFYIKQDPQVPYVHTKTLVNLLTDDMLVDDTLGYGIGYYDSWMQDIPYVSPGYDAYIQSNEIGTLQFYTKLDEKADFIEGLTEMKIWFEVDEFSGAISGSDYIGATSLTPNKGEWGGFIDTMWHDDYPQVGSGLNGYDTAKFTDVGSHVKGWKSSQGSPNWGRLLTPNSGSNEFDAYAVVMLPTGETGGPIFSQAENTTSFGTQWWGVDASFRPYFKQRTSVFTASVIELIPDTWHVIRFWSPTASNHIYCSVDGVVEELANVGVTSGPRAASWGIGTTNRDGGPGFLGGEMAEAIVCAEEQTAENATAILDYFTEKYVLGFDMPSIEAMGTAAVDNGSSTSVTPTIPAYTTEPNDYGLIIYHSSSGGGVPTTPAGWTYLGKGATHTATTSWLFGKALDGTELDPVIESNVAATARLAANVLVIRDVDSSTIWATDHTAVVNGYPITYKTDDLPAATLSGKHLAIDFNTQNYNPVNNILVTAQGRTGLTDLGMDTTGSNDHATGTKYATLEVVDPWPGITAPTWGSTDGYECPITVFLPGAAI